MNDNNQQLNNLEFEFKNHNHNNLNSFRINPIDLLVLNQLVTDATIAPTDSPVNGTVRVLYDATHWRIWVRVNKLWKSVALT